VEKNRKLTPYLQYIIFSPNFLLLFHLFADNIAIYKADTVILGCRSPQGNNLLRGAYRKNKVSYSEHSQHS